ncbi:MAG: diacylglycerol kinase family protein, partial [Thermoplasmata archaeon]
MRIKFIINPAAGAGQKEIVEIIRKGMAEFSGYYDISFTQGAGYATGLAYWAAARKYDMVVAVGGDGTISEVVNGLAKFKGYKLSSMTVPEPQLQSESKGFRGKIEKNTAETHGDEYILMDDTPEGAREAASEPPWDIGSIRKIFSYTSAVAMPSLGIVPNGSGNDLIKTLKIPADPKEAVSLLLKGKAKMTDIGYIVLDEADNKAAHRMFFINGAGSGFDAAVAMDKQNMRNSIKGLAGYIVAFFKNLRTYTSFKGELILWRESGTGIEFSTESPASIEYDGLIHIVTIGNGRYFGGIFPLTPRADLTDGALEIMVVTGITNAHLLRKLPVMFRKKH